MLEKLKTAPYKEQVGTLAIGKFVDNLTESHAAFEQLFASRSQEKLQKVSYDVKQLSLIVFDKSLRDKAIQEL